MIAILFFLIGSMSILLFNLHITGLVEIQFISKISKKLREWKLKRYKSKKVKEEKKNSPERIYHMFFKLAIRDNNGLIESDNLFDIRIPAKGFFFAKKKLEKFIKENVDVEVVNFESLSDDEEDGFKNDSVDKKIIGVDLDSTLIETNAAAHAAKDLNLPYTNKDSTHWGYLNFPENLRKRIMEYFIDSTFMCDQAKPIEGAQAMIKKWHDEGHRIVLITARSEPIREKTIEMVTRLFPEITDINFVAMDQSKKNVMIYKKIDMWIDDAESGVLDSLNLGIKTIMVSNNYTKYNWKLRDDIRLYSMVKKIEDINQL